MNLDTLFEDEPLQARETPPLAAALSQPMAGAPPVDTALTLQQVAMAAIERLEQAPENRRRLNSLFFDTLRAYRWIEDVEYQQGIALGYLDDGLKANYGKRIVIDSYTGAGDAFWVMEWRLLPCDKALAALPNAAHSDGDKELGIRMAYGSSGLLPGMERVV